MNPDSTPPLRTWLFAPANHARRREKALAASAHAVILDLEDAVPAQEKSSAREELGVALASRVRQNLFVRINALDTEHAFDDVATVVVAALRGLVLPKTESARDVVILDWLLTQAERGAGLAVGSVEIVPLLETAVAFENLAEICRASPRVRNLAFGAADFTLDLGLTWSDDEHELMPWRAAMVVASRAAGIAAPIDTPWIKVSDAAGMAASASRARAHGFAGKLCIHPDQIGLIHAAYAPGEAQLAEARRVVAAFEAAGSAATKLDGRMIDGPVVAAARRMLDEAADSKHTTA